MCLAVENIVSCKTQLNQGAPVCAWRNVLLQPCMTQLEIASLDQIWVYDEGTGAMMASGGFQISDNVCMEACTDRNYAQGACSLIDNNVGEPRADVDHPARCMCQ